MNPAARVLSGLKTAVREPIVHFLAVGLSLYGVYALVNTSTSANLATKEIPVDRETVLNFMQYRAKAFEPALFEKRLNAMLPDEQKEVVADYVREEVLYREAMALGLQEGDYIIRQRMIQKLKFLIEDTVVPKSEPSRPELVKFYAEHQNDYVEPPIYTFTHVFLDSKTRPDARTAAQETLTVLNKIRASFQDAERYGDRPLYFQNYVERTRDFVVSHFGEALTAALDNLEPSERAWRGPFESPFGWHLVMLTKRDPARLPELSEVQAKVVEDYKRLRLDTDRQIAINRLVKHYHVSVQDLTKPSSTASAVAPGGAR